MISMLSFMKDSCSALVCMMFRYRVLTFLLFKALGSSVLCTLERMIQRSCIGQCRQCMMRPWCVVNGDFFLWAVLWNCALSLSFSLSLSLSLFQFESVCVNGEFLRLDEFSLSLPPPSHSPSPLPLNVSACICGMYVCIFPMTYFDITLWPRLTVYLYTR